MEGLVVVELAVLWLSCLVAEGATSNPWESFRGKSPSSWDSAGSRYAAPGLFLSTWGDSGGRAVVFPVSPIVLQCKEADMVVTVKRDFFGTGKLVQASDLKLGAAFCKYTSLGAADNTVTFQLALQDCGNTLQITPDLLVYNSVLTYNPASSGSTVIIRSNPVAVLIQCLYPRLGNVSSYAIHPTWIPFSSTVYAEGSFLFSLRLMNDNWSAERTSTTFQLGDVFNIEASVNTGNHVSMMVYVDSCVATLTADQSSSPRYDIITSNGCLVDGKLSDSSSAFRSPRLYPDKLQFTIDAFRFIGDSRSSIYITCNLKAVDATLAPNTVNKACSYSAVSSSWSSVEGPSAICSCCDSGNCASLKPMGGSRYVVPGSRRIKRSIAAETVETVAVLGPLIILTNEELKRSMALHGAVEESWSVLALALVGSAVVLSVLILGVFVLCKRRRAS